MLGLGPVAGLPVAGIAGNTYSDAVTESVAASDAVAGRMTIPAAITESLTAADAFSTAATFRNALTESVVAADLESTGNTTANFITEALTAADALSSTATFLSQISESVAAADLMSAAIVYSASVSESLSASDGITASKVYVDNIAENIAAVDSVVNTQTFYDLVVEALIASDTMSSGTTRADVLLSGVIGFQTSFRTRRVPTGLDFTVVEGDDNVVQFLVNQESDGSPVDLGNASVLVSFYAPGTTSPAVVTKTGGQVRAADGYFQFTLYAADTALLQPGLCPVVAVITLADGTHHTVTCGDYNMTTGIMQLVERP